MKYCIYMNVGPLIYEINSDVPCRIRKDYRQFFFQTEQAIPGFDQLKKIHCDVHLVDQFSSIEGNLLYQNPERMIFGSNGREYRLHAGIRDVCGIYRELSGKNNLIEIELIRSEIPEFEINLVFLEMLALERHLLEEYALILHSSYIVWNHHGIVFTAPSGTGKSTQADLWHQYEDAEIINGDRSLLWWNPSVKRYEVCGLPFCGSSGINQNVTAPLSAIVFLSQAKKNQAEEASASESIQKLFQEISINQWNPSAVEKSLKQIERIADLVPTVNLHCNMEQGAVETLKTFLLTKQIIQNDNTRSVDSNV